MSSRFKSLEEDEVIRFNYKPIGEALGVQIRTTYDNNHFSEVAILEDHLKTVITERINVLEKTRDELVGDGVDCEVLKFNSKGWEKGKLKMRIVFEFCPDEPEVSEPESPLDEMRKALEKNS